MQTTMTVPVHVTKTLAEIEAEIAERNREISQLTQTRDTLRELFGVPPPEPEATPKPKAKPVRTPKAAMEPQPETADSSRTTGRAMTAQTLGVVAEIRKAPEPFTSISLVTNTASGMDKGTMAKLLCRLEGKGWIARVGRGLFQRTANFPAETPTN